MKKMRLFYIMLLTVSIMSATNTIDSNDPCKGVGCEISEILKNPSVPINKDCEATVVIQFTEDNRIKVLSVECENGEISNYLKERLDNRKVGENKMSKTKKYSLPIKLITRSS